MGRSFYSPSKTGLYMSFLIHQPLMVENSLLVTAAAAVAVADATEKICQVTTQIKWVNDIYINGKKVCGILTEGSFNIETGLLDYIIIGIGVNIFTEAFPDEIEKTATSVLTKEHPEILRNNLAAEIINNLISYCDNGIKSETFMPRYKSLSFIIGKNINIISGDKKEPAFVSDIDEKAQLIIIDKNQQKRIINSGEVSIRLNN
ncbi:MAG: hypothetical protein K0S55_844 [Clostridia bacterium]|nr:hypothetical protein [Clostridia bacterium]